MTMTGYTRSTALMCCAVVALATLVAPVVGTTGASAGAPKPEQEVAATSLAAAQARLADMVGSDALREVGGTPDGSAFLARIRADQGALDAFTTSPPYPADAAASLRVWQRIDAADSASRSGLLQRIAIATALEHGVPVLPWSEWGDTTAATIDPVKRYAFYRDAHAAGTLYPCFDTLAVWELRRVVDVPLYDEDVAWFHTHLPKPELHTQDRIGDALTLVKYLDRNPNNGQSIHSGKPFYDGKRWTPAIILEYGGVCGAVAKFGSFAARAHGVPAQPIGQEGHCALAWLRGGTEWVTANCGPDAFAWSNLHSLWPGFTARGDALLLYAAVAESPGFTESFHAAQLATGGMPAGATRREALVEAAEEHCSGNYALWRQAVVEAAADPSLTVDEARELAQGCMFALAPLAPQMAIDLAIHLEQTAAWQALPKMDRIAWNEGLQGAFLRGRANATLGTAASNRDKGAWQELMARLLWMHAGQSRGFGEFPLLEHQAILSGKNKAIAQWWERALLAEKRACVDSVVSAARRAGLVPGLSKICAETLVSRCMDDPALRERAGAALVAAGDACRRAGQGKEALELARAAILEGERVGDRAWVVRFTAEAKKAKGATLTGESR